MSDDYNNYSFYFLGVPTKLSKAVKTPTEKNPKRSAPSNKKLLPPQHRKRTDQGSGSHIINDINFIKQLNSSKFPLSQKSKQ